MPVRVGANTDCEYPLPAALVDTPPAPNAGMVNVNTGAQVVVPAEPGHGVVTHVRVLCSRDARKARTSSQSKNQSFESSQHFWFTYR